MSITNRASITQPHFRVPGARSPGPPSHSDPRIAFFNHHAPTWEKDGEDTAQVLQRLESLRPRLGLQPGQDLLELGCGTGRLTQWLADSVRPGRVIAADFSPEMLAQAQARNVDAEFWLMDICAAPPARELFDVVFCFNAFPHFRDKPQALRGVSQLLKPGGRLIILHLAGSAHLNHFHSQLAHPVCHDLMPTREEWPGLLGGAQMELQSFTDEVELFLLSALARKTGACADSA
ncbi:MAG: methyltransferase domain-containing protein [Verrucomicrobiae bacterium]|nr:methyltransferase domain-containing protein [Verrucomicrobiae bacterium]